MSFDHATWALKANTRTPTQKLILIAIAHCADTETGKCWPGQKSLSETTGLSIPTVQRAIKELEAQGFFKRKKRFRENGIKTSDMYILPPITVIADSIDHISSDTPTTYHSDRTNNKSGNKSNNPPMVPPNKPAKRATSLPELWKPSQQDIEYAVGKGLSAPEIKIQAEKFNNYWHARAGPSGVKLDWPATWRNWIINALEYREERGSFTNNNPTSQSRTDQFLGEFVKRSSA